jgi:hypothetical protein
LSMMTLQFESPKTQDPWIYRSVLVLDDKFE